MRRVIGICVGVGLAVVGWAAPASPISRPELTTPSGATAVAGLAVSERYVEEALAANIALTLRTTDLAVARARLAEARGAWQPRVDVVARYSRADGGRSIDLPVGDLLNGAYRTLNDYLVSQGRAAVFPQIDNQSISLLREREQETKLRVTQPLYRPEISAGVRGRRAMVEAEAAQVAAYRRELRLAVLSAYHRYLQAAAGVRILESAGVVAEEARRVNQVLFETDKVTEDRVLRAEADALSVEQQRRELERDRTTAQAYFNFLLNRALDAPIEEAEEDAQRAYAVALTTAAERVVSISGREELVALEAAVRASESAETATRARGRPTLDLAVDGGVQGEDYRVSHGSGFVQGSLVAQVNVWDGRQNRQVQQQAKLATEQARLRLAEARQQLDLQARQARDERRAAVAAFRATERRREALRRTLELVTQRDREGMASQLAFLDARNEATRAELDHVIARHRLFVAEAGLDRALAQTVLP